MPVQNLIEFILYIAPGFIAIYVYRLRYPVREKESFAEISACVVFGLLIIVILKWFDKHYFKYFFNSNCSGIPSVRFTFGILLFGIIGGLLGIAQVEIRNFFAKHFHYLTFLSKSTDTIWEFINDKTQKNWAVVFLNDDTIYSGWISKYTYDPHNQSQEFLLSNAENVDKNLKRIYIVDGLGVYLNTKDVKRIELVKGKD